MNDAPVDSSTTAAVSVAIPSMAMSELKQKVKEWYSDQKYADNTLKEAMVVFDNLCDYIGNQSVYASQLGQDYMEYEYGRKNYSKSAKGEISRCVYIIDCLAFGKPISTRRSTFEPENVLSPGDNPVPFVLFSELNQMIQD